MQIFRGMKESFILYNNQYDCLKDLSDAQLGNLFRALYQMRRGEEYSFSDGFVEMAFNFISNQFVVDDKKFDKRVEQRRAAALASVSARQRALANADLKEKEKEKEKEKGEGDKNAPAPVREGALARERRKELDLSVIPQEWMPTVKTWLDYKKARKESYVQAGINAFFTKLKNLSGGNIQVAGAIIEQSMANNWAGIFALKESKPRFSAREDVSKTQFTIDPSREVTL